MFTLSVPHSRTVNRFFKEWALDSATLEESSRETWVMTSESLKKVQEFAQRVIDAFENNPEARKAFLESVDGIKQDVFKSPDMFRAFVERAYEKHAEAIDQLEWMARTQKIKDFSVFIRDVMLQFADMNNMEAFARTIRTQTEALEKKYKVIQEKTSDATSILRTEITQS